MNKSHPKSSKADDSELKALVLRDEVKEHCENIAVIAGLLAACQHDSAPKVVEPALATRAANLILNEVHILDETLQRLYARLSKS